MEERTEAVVFLLPRRTTRLTGVNVVFAVLAFILALAHRGLYAIFKRRRKSRLREKNFERNGGLLLQQQLSAVEDGFQKAKFFTSKELEKATDHFNESRILGQGGQGTVYKGMLGDGRIVAVKKSKLVDDRQSEQFINEVFILSQINHRNIVRLLGCCLETEIPLLVYEFIPNGDLYRLIHCGSDEVAVSWDMRLRIATDVAGALAYLHNAVSVPILHRDIKSSNVLLDEKYRAKVSDFGIARSISVDQTHLTTQVKGTFGYFDPEYFQSSQFTEKSDVYSFGVVLVELLTGHKPILSTREEKSLVMLFRTLIEENRLSEILDDIVQREATKKDLWAISLLARRCLELNGKNRPTMKEVAVELESIRMSLLPSRDEKHLQRERSDDINTTVNLETYTWTSMDVASSSVRDGHPLLFDNV